MEIISIHAGGAGVNLGIRCWDHFYREHYLLPNGGMNPDNPVYNELLEYNTFFEEIQTGVYRPRALLVDCVQDTIIKLKQNQKLSIFGKDQIVTGNEASSCVYAKGYGYAGKKIIERSLEAIRLMAEECDLLQGFIFYRSLGGGTGSGFTSLLEEKLNSLYGKTNIHEYSILPGSHPSSSPVDVYNLTLSIANTLKSPKCAFMFDNNLVYSMCQKKLGIEDPLYEAMNEILTRVVSAMTSSLRFQSALNVTLEDFTRCLVPVPNLCFPVVSFSPVFQKGKSYELSTQELIINGFSDENQFLNCHIKEGDLIASCLLFTGNARSRDANKTLNKLRSSKFIRFTDWSPSMLKAGFNPRSTKVYPENRLAVTTKQLCALTNTTEFSKIINRVRTKYEKLLERKAFFHLYAKEGMEDLDFINVADELLELELDYIDVRRKKKICESEKYEY